MRFRFTASVIVLVACTSNRDRAIKELGLGTMPGEDGSASVTSYTPSGCTYTVTPPSSRGFSNMTLDSQASVSAPDATPIRVRLGLGGNTDSSAAGYPDPTTTIAMTWETAGDVSASRVRYGKSMGTLDKVQSGYSWTTPPPNFPLLGNDEPAVHMHEVHVCGLEAGTTYYYQVGGGAPGSEVWSDVQSFTTLPSSGKIVVGVSGDARDHADVFALVQKRMRDNAVSMQVFTGDLVLYGTDEMRFTNWLDPIWKDSTQAGKFVTLGQQLMVLIAGNHENASSQFYGNFVLPGDGDYAETFGSFDVGTVHFAFIDDQRIGDSTTGDQATAQLAFIKADLDRANKDRAKHPFIVFMNHRPEFSTSNHKDDGDTKNVRNALVPLFDQYGVDLVLGGHDHDFERSKPVKGPYDTPTIGQGATYLVCAGAGADSYSTGTAAYSEKAVGFGGGTPYVGLYSLMTIDGNTLRVQSFGLRASGMDDMIDDFTLMH